MDMSEHVASLRRELENLTRFANEDVARAAGMLTDAMESSVRLTLLEVLSAAAAEITTALDDAVLDVRLTGSDADFVVTPTADEPEAGPSQATSGDVTDDVTRITLRLPENLKVRAEAAAVEAGMSVNAWLVRAVSQALDAPRGRPGRPKPTVGQRYTGYVRG
jgi:hypothetical protein